MIETATVAFTDHISTRLEESIPTKMSPVIVTKRLYGDDELVLIVCWSDTFIAPHLNSSVIAITCIDSVIGIDEDTFRIISDYTDICKCCCIWIPWCIGTQFWLIVWKNWNGRLKYLLQMKGTQCVVCRCDSNNVLITTNFLHRRIWARLRIDLIWQRKVKFVTLSCIQFHLLT